MQRKLLTILALTLVLAISMGTVAYGFVTLIAIGMGFLLGMIVGEILMNPGVTYVKVASEQMQTDLHSYWQNIAELSNSIYHSREEDAAQFSNVFFYSYNYYVRWAESIASSHCSDDNFSISWFAPMRKDIADNILIRMKMEYYAELGIYNIAAANNRQMLDLVINQTKTVEVPIVEVDIRGKVFIPYGNITLTLDNNTLAGIEKYLDNRALYKLGLANITNITIPYSFTTDSYVELNPELDFNFGNQYSTLWNVRNFWLNLTNYNVTVVHKHVVINTYVTNLEYPYEGLDGSYISGSDVTGPYIYAVAQAYNYWKTLHQEYENGSLSGDSCPVIPPPSISTPFDPREAWKYDPIAMKALWIAYLKALSSHNWTADPTLDSTDIKGLTDKLVWIKADLDVNHDGTVDYSGCYFIPVGINENVTFEVGKTTVLRDGGWGYYYCPSTNTLKLVNLAPNTTVTNIQAIQDRRPIPVDLDGDGKYDTIEYNTTRNVTSITINPANAKDFIKTVPTLPDVTWSFIPNEWRDGLKPPEFLTNLFNRLFGWLHINIDKTKLLLLGAGLVVLFILFNGVGGTRKVVITPR